MQLKVYDGMPVGVVGEIADSVHTETITGRWAVDGEPKFGGVYYYNEKGEVVAAQGTGNKGVAGVLVSPKQYAGGVDGKATIKKGDTVSLLTSGTFYGFRMHYHAVGTLVRCVDGEWVEVRASDVKEGGFYGVVANSCPNCPGQSMAIRIPAAVTA